MQFPNTRFARAVVACWLILNLAARCALGTEPTAKFAHQVVLVTGVEDPRMRPIDELMTSFLREHNVPGAALAVADGDKLVYARGFGFANPQRKTPVLPTSLFRVASISKPITAVAILQLVERGQLKLDERVFDILQIEPYFEGERHEMDSRLQQITVLHLLQHTAGWDRDESFDPMFQSVRIARCLQLEPPAGPEAIIRFMKGQLLDFAPGERYAYSNFGYCLLGRIIEQRTGKSYEQFVRENVFQPLGVTRPHIGHTRSSSSFEVSYADVNGESGPSVFQADVDQLVPDPYGTWYLEAMDAHGGWIASAVDLVRFASALHSTQHPLLGEQSVKTMLARPEGRAGTEANGSLADAYYGCGWMVRPREGAGHLGYNVWHAGLLDGTSTLLVTRADGRHWAILFNRDRFGDDTLASLIDPLVHQAVDQVSEWPATDQFPLYLAP